MRRPIRNRIRLKHLNASGKWPSGNVRYYFRPKGLRAKPLPDLPPDDPRFLAEYIKLSGVTNLRTTTPKSGTISASIHAYFKSDKYLSMAMSTRMLWRRQLHDIEDRYGKALIYDLRARHIRQDLARLEAHPANTRRKVWRSICRWWLDTGMIEEDPSRDVRPRATPPTMGWTPWTRDDVSAFRKHWSYDTPQRLAFELMHRTCASIGDACLLGPGMITDNWLTYSRKKSKSVAVCPMNADNTPKWFEHDEHLANCLAVAPRHMTWMVTNSGAPRSPKAAAQWFSRACQAAGLDPGKSAHGIRKHRAAVFKENGATPEQRMAILGHDTQAEAMRYSKSADLKKTISGTESSNFQKSSNFESVSTGKRMEI